MRRTILWAGLLTALAVAGCGGPNDDPIDSSSDLAPVCTRGTSFTRAVPFEGPAPHPIRWYSSSAGNGVDFLSPNSYSPHDAFPGREIDEATSSAYGVGTDYARVQLVGCVKRVDAVRTGTTCTFDGDASPLAAATYELSVHEARTAEQVGETIRIEPDNQDCPTAAVVDADDPEVYTQPSPAQVLGAVRSYVEG